MKFAAESTHKGPQLIEIEGMKLQRHAKKALVPLSALRSLSLSLSQQGAMRKQWFLLQKPFIRAALQTRRFLWLLFVVQILFATSL